MLIEHLLPGREFNVSAVWGPLGLEVLPPAEMTFVGFESDEPRIVGWAAKWDASSHAYQGTVRRFLDGDEGDLHRALVDTTRAAWRACGLAGYGRVDIRLDESGNPLESAVYKNFWIEV